MQLCANCGASNFDAAKFCNECGQSLAPLGQEGGGAGAAPPHPSTLIRGSAGQPPANQQPRTPTPAANVLDRVAALRARRSADILFVLDCTGSMQGEIDAIKEAITAFADTIESHEVRARVGLIEFRDRLIDEEHRALTFDGECFTADPAAFRREVAALRASGGGDEPESSLDALMLALRQPFSPDAGKVIVLVTDAPPHLPDKATQSLDEVVEAIRAAGIQQLYLVIRTQEAESQIYLRLLEGARGMAFEIGRGNDFRNRAEHFKRTLMSLGKTISQSTR